MRRLHIPSAALLWGLQFAFLNPALALLLVTLFDATPGQVGTVLAVYNASGFLASLLLPAYADRTKAYLRVMFVCGLLTLALAGLLAVTMSLPVAVVGLMALGGPAGVRYWKNCDQRFPRVFAAGWEGRWLPPPPSRPEALFTPRRLARSRQRRHRQRA